MKKSMNSKPQVTLEIGLNEICGVTEMFDVATAREKLIKYFKENSDLLSYRGVPYELDLVVKVKVIAMHNSDIVCTEEFVCSELKNRPYDEKFSNAINAMTIMRDTMKHIESDINYFGSKDVDGKGYYGKRRLKEDFAKLQEAHLKQSEYMLEIAKEIQKSYSMY